MSAEQSSTEKPFFVGYLPLPPVYKRFLWILLPILLMGALILALVIGSSQRNPGAGSWDIGSIVELEGTLYQQPYAAIQTLTPAGEQVSVLLVSQTKFGVADRVAGMDGQQVKVVGNLIRRDGQHMLTVLNDERGIQLAGSAAWAALQQLPAQSLGNRTLVGEIIDSKCALGAMKPGDGKVHKSCATLCILGGMPPMFMTRDGNGNSGFYLLTDSAGQAADFETIKAFIADPVELSGELVQRGHMRILRADLSSLRFL